MCVCTWREIERKRQSKKQSGTQLAGVGLQIRKNKIKWKTEETKLIWDLAIYGKP